MREYWERLRRQGLWPVPIWVSDVNDPEPDGDPQSAVDTQSAPVTISEPDPAGQAFVEPTSYDWFGGTIV
nr:antitoxin MazE-like protein [Mycobacterium spongiae]